MRLEPLGDKVIVKRLSAEDRTAGGIVLPDSAQEKPQQGRVLSVGDGGRSENGAAIAPQVKEGDRVVFTSYAGQEGSFVLWTVWVALLGAILIPYLKKRGWEAEVMAFYSGVLVFLILLLVVKNPFAFVWESFAKDGIAEGVVPPNGLGLIPLLHNV